MSRRVRTYQGDGIEVGFDARRCIHAARCVRSLPLVFDPQRRPWIKLDESEAGTIAKVVEQCPTGALTYECPDKEGEAASPRNSISVRSRGPLFLRGDIEIELPGGESVNETRVALCRCGASENKPFCDNSHRAAEFDDPGVLATSRLAGEAAEDGQLRLRVASGGPVLLNGPVEITGTSGAVQEGEKGALCRCGASGSKPYCDGSHKAIDFESQASTDDGNR